MADNGNDFVVYPKEYEERRRMEQNETPLDLSQTFSTPPPPPPPLSQSHDVPAGNENPDSSIARIIKKAKRKPKPNVSEYEEKVIRISKLALLLAKNGAYNDKLELRGRDGEFITGSNVAKFFKFATHGLRKFDHVHDYIHQLLALNEDVTSLISNPVLIHAIGLEKAKLAPTTSDGIEREGSIDQTEVESELKKSDRPTPVKTGSKRRRSEDEAPLDLDDDTLWTAIDPKKVKQNQQVGDGSLEWIPNPEIDKAMAEMIKEFQ